MRRLALALAVAGSAFGTGCAALQLGLANGLDLTGAYQRLADIPYGSGARQTFDVYLPRAVSATPRRLVVFVHGGRWSSGSKSNYRFVAAGLAERGIVVVVPNYRLYPAVRMAEAAADVAQAVAFAEKSAERYGADGAHITLMGHSAGAQLAALIACDPHWLADAGGRPVNAFVGLAGPYDFLPLTDADLIDYFGPPERYPASQPVNFVSSASPPAFLVHGLADSIAWPRNTRSLADHLTAAGVPVEIRLMPGEGHGGVLKHFARLYRGDDALFAEIVKFVLAPPSRAPAG